MKRYDGDYTEALDFQLPDKDIRFGKESSITTEIVGIYIEDTATGIELTLDGDITTTGYGIYSAANRASITIGKNAEIQSAYPIVAYGENQSLTNAGKITATDVGILLQGSDSRMVNDGSIEAYTGVVLQSSVDGLVINGSSGEIDAQGYGVTFGGASDANRNKLVNLGTISSDVYAFYGSSSIEQVVNRGLMEGDIYLSAGNDLFNGRGGRLVGRVDGGGDDDKYFIDDAKIDIFEQANNGTDTVLSSVDYRLPDDFENLTLTGRKNLTGHGNDGNNPLIGNAGDNRLYGSNGSDVLSGGEGSDRLNGGLEEDLFVFRTGDGHDKIEDFEDGIDRFDLGGWKGLVDYDDFISHAREKNGDLIISFKGDQLTIDNFSKAQFDEGDFQG